MRAWMLAALALAAGCRSGLIDLAGDGDLAIAAAPDLASTTDLAATPRGDRRLTGRYSHFCYVLADATVRCWGLNYDGQLGDGTRDRQGTPVEPLGLGRVVSVAAGGLHTCALKDDGGLWCWGYDAYGAFGRGVFAGVEPAPVRAAKIDGIVELAAGYAHTWVRLGDGTTRAFGENNDLQLGIDNASSDGEGVDVATPIPGPIDNVSDIIPGDFDSCALRRDGSLWCWGLDAQGEIGDGTIAPNGHRATPGLVLEGVTGASYGYNTGCAIVGGGRLRCWGDGVPSPAPVDDRLAATQVAVATGAFCALLEGGTVWCTRTPGTGAPVDGLDHVREIAVGVNVACARKDDDSVWCWGLDEALHRVL